MERAIKSLRAKGVSYWRGAKVQKERETDRKTEEIDADIKRKIKKICEKYMEIRKLARRKHEELWQSSITVCLFFLLLFFSFLDYHVISIDIYYTKKKDIKETMH